MMRATRTKAVPGSASPSRATSRAPTAVTSCCRIRLSAVCARQYGCRSKQSNFWRAKGEPPRGKQGRPAMAEINLRVVDLFHGDRVTSFQKAADFGIWGIIHKATTGATGKDGKYAGRRKPALAAGLLWGAYHWGTHADVRKQVDHFLTTADPDENTLVALDYEDTPGNQMTLAQAREFLSLMAE